MEQKINDFLIHLKNTKKISDNTMMSYKRDLLKMVSFFESNGIKSFSKVTATNINSFILSLEKAGKSSSTVARNISSINTFFRYLLTTGEISGDPTETIKIPKVDKKIPEVLTVEEMDRLLSKANGKGEKAFRDKAILELLYATGIRVSELINIKISDVNMQLGYIVCKNEKKERVIPFGNKAKVAISRYLYEYRDKKEGDMEELFLNCFNEKMSRQGVWKIIKYYARLADIKKDITPHTIRHSFGAHLIGNGADMKDVQEMMGHADISSTAIYSNMDTTELKNKYMKAHPRG